MSINAINSVSLYEYYYSIGKKDEEKKKKEASPLADEMRKYGLNPTDNEALNIQMLNKAKAEALNQNPTQQTTPNYERPWADIMYQLNLSFNEDPKDDIADIKDELKSLIKGIQDDELEQEIQDLESYVEKLYLDFQQTNIKGFDNSSTLTAQLNNLSMLNQVKI